MARGPVPPQSQQVPPPEEPDPELILGRGWKLQAVGNVLSFRRVLATGKHWEDAWGLYCFYSSHAQARGQSAVYATREFCRRGLGWSEERVKRARGTLLELGLIEDLRIRYTDGPRRNMVRRCLVAVHFLPKGDDVYRAGFPTGRESAPQKGTNPNSKGKEENLTVPAGGGDGVSKDNDPLREQWNQLATRLDHIIRSRKNIKHTPRQLQGWATQFKRLHREGGVSPERMFAVLAWYRSHVGEPFVPVIESGTSFREKFLKLEAAIEREQTPAPKMPSRTPALGTAPLTNPKTIAALQSLLTVWPGDVPALDAQVTALRAHLDAHDVRGAIRDLFAAWLDSRAPYNGAWLRKDGTLRPGHLDPAGQTVHGFTRWARWYEGHDD